MFSMKHTLIVIGAVVAGLGLVAPASGKFALPEDYQLPSQEPVVGYSPQALEALGLRGEAMATYFEESNGYSPQALQALGERGEAMNRQYLGEPGRQSPDVIQSPTREQIGIDAVGRTSPTVTGSVAYDSFDWNRFGVAGGTALLLAALGIAGVVGVRNRGRVAHS